MDSDKIIDAWLVERIYGSVIARNTECWNHLLPEIDNLKARLRAKPEPAKTVKG